MQAQARSRKRGADPSAADQASYPSYNQHQQQPMQAAAYNANDPLASFRNPVTNDMSTEFNDFSAFGDAANANAAAAAVNFFPSQLTTNTNTTQAPSYGPAVAPTSNQLVRRNTNQQVVHTPQRNQWANFANSADRVWENMEDGEDQGLDLDTKAALAKKDAQAKRKQIPPFVQKLSSFLDSKNNTELIRWSDDGDSFIVIDEDEFARTLIPELFKHNNYASFVRQLNMYGFHKKVGLNANSMKAAEKKVKDPSVYWHEYFKRGRPDLLWLIQKPQAKSSSAKRKRDSEKRDHVESDDEVQKASPEAPDTATGPMATIPKQDMTTFRSELQRLRQQQNVISSMIKQLKEQNEQFYRQATAFQALHDRHENSINAILTFLATFYNRSLEGQAGQNLVNMFNSASIPQQAQQQGSVFDMGDGDMSENNNTNNVNPNNVNHNNVNPNNPHMPRFQKRPLLLGAPPQQQNLQSPSPFMSSVTSGRSSTSPARDLPYHRPPPMQHQQQAMPQQNRPMGPPRPSVTPVMKDDAPTPDLLNQFPENDDMMNLINKVNASNSPNNAAAGNSPAYDFSTALDQLHAASGNAPLTAQQRDDMLSLIANKGAGAGSQAAQPGANNALMTPNPPPMPSLEQFNKNQEKLDVLTKLQHEQDLKLADLGGRLQPLSPTGNIPGIADQNLDLGNPGDFDLSSYINTDVDYFPNYPTDNNNNNGLSNSDQQNQNQDFASVQDGNNTLDDFDVDWDLSGNSNAGLGDGDDLFGEGAGDDGGVGRVVGSVSSTGTSPPGEAGGINVDGDDETPSKRRRTGN